MVHTLGITLGVLIFSVGLLACIVSFLVDTRIKRIISYSISFLIIFMGVFSFMQAQKKRIELNNKIFKINSSRDAQQGSSNVSKTVIPSRSLNRAGESTQVDH